MTKAFDGLLVLRQNPHIWSISDLNILKIKKCFFEFFSTKTVLEVSLNFLEHTKKYLQAPGTPKLLLRRNKKTEKISLVISPEIFFMKTKFPLVISPETRYNKNYSITDFFESVRKT